MESTLIVKAAQNFPMCVDVTKPEIKLDCSEVEITCK